MAIQSDIFFKSDGLTFSGKDIQCKKTLAIRNGNN